jgi:hypothetical protein
MNTIKQLVEPSVDSEDQATYNKLEVEFYRFII